jgi:hypothetical protein
MKQNGEYKKSVSLIIRSRSNIRYANGKGEIVIMILLYLKINAVAIKQFLSVFTFLSP